MRIIRGYQNTKTNNEDFAITPYFSARKKRLKKPFGLLTKILRNWNRIFIGTEGFVIFQVAY